MVDQSCMCFFLVFVVFSFYYAFMLCQNLSKPDTPSCLAKCLGYQGVPRFHCLCFHELYHRTYEPVHKSILYTYLTFQINRWKCMNPIRPDTSLYRRIVPVGVRVNQVSLYLDEYLLEGALFSYLDPIRLSPDISQRSPLEPNHLALAHILSL